jgi:beta-galactosidase
MQALPRFLSGEMHYARIPRAYWRDRLRMARAMGVDAVSTYVFWNRHEPAPGRYDFEGENDVAQFLRLAQSEGLDVILRPGPYVCAEWDFGGLPAWLLERGARIRSTDPAFMEPVRRWLERLGSELAGLQRAHGGPIIAVQLENEYGAFGSDRAYLHELREALRAAQFSQSPMFTIDQPADLERGCLDDVPAAVTFAPGDPSPALARLRALRPHGPLVCGEYWAGWFDHWGEAHHVSDVEAQVADLRWMLRAGCSINVYMLHGGTNFGFWNGANAAGDAAYAPTTTSYDYDAAIDEAGRATQKFLRIRDVIAQETGRMPPPIPAQPQTGAVPEFGLVRQCDLLQADLGAGLTLHDPIPMEQSGEPFGYTLYRTEIDGPVEGDLEIADLRDYAVVYVDGAVSAHLDRRLGQRFAPIRCSAARCTLDILVENGGRINYGPMVPFERKGITRAVFLNGAPLHGWSMYSLPLRDPRLLLVHVPPAPSPGPALYRGAMRVDVPADTFLDVRALGKGALWVNGRNAGRFWNIGPQRTLYVPGVWLHPGSNDVVVFDLFAHETQPSLRGLPNPVFEPVTGG